MGRNNDISLSEIDGVIPNGYTLCSECSGVLVHCGCGDRCYDCRHGFDFSNIDSRLVRFRATTFSWMGSDYDFCDGLDLFTSKNGAPVVIVIMGSTIVIDVMLLGMVNSYALANYFLQLSHIGGLYKSEVAYESLFSERV